MLVSCVSFSVSEWWLENGIWVTMVCYHNVLVTTPGYNWKAATIISIQLTDCFIPNMQLFCFDRRWNIFHLLFFWCNLEDSLFTIICGVVLFLIYSTPWEDWTMWPFIVSTARGQYLDTFEYVRPGHVSNFLFLLSWATLTWLGTLMPHVCTALVLPCLGDCRHCTPREFFSYSLEYGAVAAPCLC